MTLFDIEQYHQPKKENYRRDWDGASYDAAWDEPEDIPPISQNEALANKEASLKEEEEGKCTLEEKYRWNPKHFGETPRKVDSNGNPTIFWDDNIEPPLPEDFESLQKYEESWQQWEKSPDNHSSVKERSGNYNTTTHNTLKAISLWQPWASLIKLGLKHYETRSWKTKYRGKLLICSAAKSTKEQYQQYLKIDSEVKLPLWDETNFLRGYALAICDLVNCIEITPEFINQQSQIEILCGDWQVGRYVWKLENIQPIAKPFTVKGKQRLFDITSTNLDCYLEKSFSDTSTDKSKSESSDGFVSLPNKFLEDKLSDEISSRKIGDDSKFLEDKLDDEISSRKVGDDSQFLEDKLNGEISSRKIGDDSKFLEDKLSDEISSRKVGDDSQFLEDNNETNISEKKTRRHKGDGSGCIYYRTVTKKGKDYSEAYYQYEFWKDGECLTKSSKYIPKRLLSKVQRLEVEKVLVKDILKLLGVIEHL
ncbi:MAG: ASCH domain-containing protein [Cyanobacteria bacterium J06621_15]